MLEKYRATIHGNTIEWDGEAPENLKGNGTVEVDVTVVSESKALPRSNGKKMAEALRKIAELGGIKSIPDPVAWQREIRKDRPLPGRE